MILWRIFVRSFLKWKTMESYFQQYTESRDFECDIGNRIFFTILFFLMRIWINFVVVSCRFMFYVMTFFVCLPNELEYIVGISRLFLEYLLKRVLQVDVIICYEIKSAELSCTNTLYLSKIFISYSVTFFMIRLWFIFKLSLTAIEKHDV